MMFWALLMLAACSGHTDGERNDTGPHTGFDTCPEYTGEAVATNDGGIDCDSAGKMVIESQSAGAHSLTLDLTDAAGFNEHHTSVRVPQKCMDNTQVWGTTLRTGVAQADWESGVKTSFECGELTTFVVRVYDEKGVMADCLCTGDEYCPGIIDGTANLPNPIPNPSELAACRFYP